MADAPVFIDPKLCKGCGKCVKGCGFGALSMVAAAGANKAGRLAEVDPSACKACGACLKACPFNAITEVRREVRGTEGIETYRDIWVFAEQSGGVVADVAHELLASGEPERTIRLEEGEVDVPAQARIDWFNPDYGIVDLKSTGDDIRWFSKAAHDYGYAFQAAFYRKLLELKSGKKYPAFLIAVEKKAPFTVGVFKFADDVLDQAEAINRETLREFADCRDSGVFPTRFEETQLIDRL